MNIYKVYFFSGLSKIVLHDSFPTDLPETWLKYIDTIELIELDIAPDYVELYADRHDGVNQSDYTTLAEEYITPDHFYDCLGHLSGNDYVVCEIIEYSLLWHHIDADHGIELY